MHDLEKNIEERSVNRRQRLLFQEVQVLGGKSTEKIEKCCAKEPRKCLKGLGTKELVKEGKND